MQDRNVIEELRRIEDTHGRLQPKDVVEAARPTTSPLHPHFEWDDSQAAEKYRIDQARALIRVCVEYVGSGQDKRKIQAFVNLTTDRNAGGGYRSMTKVLAIDSLRSQLIEDARTDMDRFRAKYSSITELAEALSVLDQAIESLANQEPKKRRKRA